MSKKREILKMVKEKLKQEIPKSDIELELSSKYQKKEYRKILKDFPEPVLKKKYQKFHNALMVFLVLELIGKIFAVTSINQGSSTNQILFWLVFSSIIPILLIINTSTYRASAYLLNIIYITYSLISYYGGNPALRQTLPLSGNIFETILFFLISSIDFIPLILSIYLWYKMYPFVKQKVSTQN